jgi:hypothetical protein
LYPEYIRKEKKCQAWKLISKILTTEET